MNIYKIRRAGDEDIGRLVEAAIETYEATFRGTCRDEDLNDFLACTYTAENFKRELNQPRSDYFLAEVEGEMTGYAWVAEGETPDCVQGPAPVELVRIYIRPGWQGKGVGRALMDHCLEHARKQGYRTMYLGVWEKNLRAQKFYAGYGFRRVGEHVFQVGSDPQTDWWLEAAL